MTVEELIMLEQKYKEENKNRHYKYNEVGEFVPTNMNEDISFLEKGYIEKHNHIKPEKKRNLAGKGLTDFEILMLMCFEGFLSYAFRWPSYVGRNRPIPEMCEGLDNVLDKSPEYDEGGVLYRFCTLDDKVDFQVNDFFELPYYLTTTKDNWGKSSNMYVITPKSNNTNARSLYKLHNHGNENQVTFKRNTSFKVTKIETFRTEEGKFKRIYMDEQ